MCQMINITLFIRYTVFDVNLDSLKIGKIYEASKNHYNFDFEKSQFDAEPFENNVLYGAPTLAAK